MAKTTRVSRAEYRNLAEALGNAKRVRKVAEYSAPAVIARLLLEAFLYEDANINSEWFVREKACLSGKFTKLRDRLIADQWIYFREDSKRYFVGVRLKPHIEVLRKSKTASLAQLEELDSKKADKIDLKELDDRKADRSELEMTRMQLEKTNAKVEEIAIAVAELQAAMLPPDSANKQEIRTRSAQKIASLSCKN